MAKGSSKGGRGGSAKISESSIQMNKPEDWYYNQLTDAEQAGVVAAQYNTANLNRYLRGDTKDMSDALKNSLKEEADVLDGALAKYKTTEETVTYRGVSADEFANVYLGIEKSTKGVKSTSYDQNRADAFARNQGGFVIEYHIKPGNHGADVNGAPGANEQEFLIRNNMPQKVVQKVGKNRLIVEIG